MSVIAHNIIAIILICVSKGRGRARGPVVPCVVGYPSPPRPCGSLCVFHVLWVIAPAPPRLLRQEAWWEGGGIPWGTSTVTWMTSACLLSAGGGGGGIPWGGGGGAGGLRRGDAAPYIGRYGYRCIEIPYTYRERERYINLHLCRYLEIQM